MIAIFDFGEVASAIKLDTYYKNENKYRDVPPFFFDVLIEDLAADEARPADEPEKDYAIYMVDKWGKKINEGIAEVTLRNVTIKSANKAIECENVNNLIMENVWINGLLRSDACD